MICAEPAPSGTLKDAALNTIAGTVSYNSGTNTATFTPNAALSLGTTYTASISATDTVGNAMTSPTSL